MLQELSNQAGMEADILGVVKHRNIMPCHQSFWTPVREKKGGPIFKTLVMVFDKPDSTLDWVSLPLQPCCQILQPSKTDMSNFAAFKIDIPHPGISTGFYHTALEFLQRLELQDGHLQICRNHKHHSSAVASGLCY